MATPIQITFDCADPDMIATFWATALDYEKLAPPEGFNSWQELLEAQGVPEDLWNTASAIVDPRGIGHRVFFQKVPDLKASKNRVHLDLIVGGDHNTPLEERRNRVDAEVGRLTEAGATKIEPRDQNGEYWVVMLDPEGNEFCIQ